jgi:outer membrane protein OmpA-like peptidoglycan-associated protein
MNNSLLTSANTLLKLVFVLLASNLIGACSSPHLIEDERQLHQVIIESSPSQAWVYINGELKGKSPITIDIERLHQHEQKITALPIFSHQFRQDLLLQPGQLPDNILINMDILSTKRSNIDPSDNNEKCNVNSHIAPAIYFNTNEFQISENQNDHLEAFVCYLKSIGNPIVKIYGQADHRGQWHENRELSLKRAISVKDGMLILNYPAEQLIASAYGETSVFSEQYQPLNLQENRKVLFEIIYEEAKTKLTR